LRPDNGANEKLYGHKLTAKEILREGKVGTPAAAQELNAVLGKASPKNRSDPKSLQ
jgi:lipid-binding SYLF domain-containing protein